MALKNLTALTKEAKMLTDRDALAMWIRSQSKYAPKDQIIRDMSKFVPGCEHPTWLDYTLTERGISFTISTEGSDSQGVAGIVVQALSGMTAREIRSVDFSEFRDIARYLNNRQQRTLNAILNKIKNIIGDSK